MDTIKLNEENIEAMELLEAFDQLSRSLNEDNLVEKSGIKTEEDVIELCRKTRSEL